MSWLSSSSFLCHPTHGSYTEVNLHQLTLCIINFLETQRRTARVTISHPLPVVKHSSYFDWCGTIPSFSKCYLHISTTRRKKDSPATEWRLYGINSSKYYYIINTVNYSETQSCRFSKSRLHTAPNFFVNWNGLCQ